MTPEPRVSRTAYLLGYAGLLPQVLAAGLVALGRADQSDLAHLPLMVGYAIATVYAAAIISFLGGIWWGSAMRRVEGQGVLAVIATLPSLAASGLALWAVEAAPSPWPLVALGSAIMATLIVDRRLVATGEAPPDWMRLRVPLSLGLGGLTILAGVLAA